jgi:D-alanine-D-alanine ligase
MNEKVKIPKSNGVRNKLPKCFGPVPNLEEYVRKDWWNTIFNSYYIKTDGDVVDDQKITSHEINVFSEILKLQPKDHILDLCCGQGRHSLELARRNFNNVEGLDRSHYLIQRARKGARKELLTVKFREGDARKLPYPSDSFDVVMILGNSFGYFESINEDLQVLKEVFRILKPWGRLFIDISDGEYIKKNFQPRSWEWIDKDHFVCRERSLSLDKQRLISREVITHVNKGVLVDQFYAERLYTKESFTELLNNAEFSNIIFNGEMATDSERNQDLGMMERRLLITAVVKKEWTKIPKKREKAIKDVAVVMGDPTKPDATKPFRKFDDDDFYTIDQLKAALRELKEYNFIFLNNHDTLVQDLIKLKGKVDYVFNLCDEGYDNDARKELHVPALLEVLEIPYTGGGPQCLAFCYDKSLVRGIAKEMGVPVPVGIYVKPEDNIIDLPLYFPAIVKPNLGDSSFGITQKCVVENGVELISAITDIREQFGYDKSILIEQFLPGKDLTLGIIGNPPKNYNILPISEDDYSDLPTELPQICGFEAKWKPDSPYNAVKSIQADLPEETIHFIESCSIKLFDRLECRDYARFDWRLDVTGNPRLLEVNPNPGWCWDGHLSKMCAYAKISYKDMILAILQSTEERLGLFKENKEEFKETIKEIKK